MPYFAAVNESGPAWNPSHSRRDREKWAEHAAYIDALASEGPFLLVGPLSPTKTLLIVKSDSEWTVKTRLAESIEDYTAERPHSSPGYHTARAFAERKMEGTRA
jgi:uncharacterized protein YciI